MLEKYPLVDRRLRLAGREWQFRAVEDQDILLDAVQTDSDLETFPYGMFIWASALGLCEWMAENASAIRGARILELGAGAGLCGILAQWLGARVLQTDYLPETIALAESNAALNGIHGIETRVVDWRRPPALDRFCLVMAADVLYERSLHEPLLDVLERTVQTNAIIADPVRPHGIEFIDRVERLGWGVRMHGRLVAWEGETREIALFQLAKRNGLP